MFSKVAVILGVFILHEAAG
jgi:hypothetical protein